MTITNFIELLMFKLDLQQQLQLLQHRLFLQVEYPIQLLVSVTLTSDAYFYVTGEN